MPKLKIEGVGTIQVDDSFTKLSPDQQNAFVADVATQARGGARSGGGAAPAASTGSDVAALAAQGASMGFGDRIAAAGDTAVNAVRSAVGAGPMEGTSPDYAGNLARYRALIGGAQDRHPIAAPAIEMASGLLTPLGAASAAAKGASLGAKVARGAMAGTALGAIQGAGAAQDFTKPIDTAESVALGAGLGGIIGGAVPTVAPAVGGAYRKVTGLLDQGAPGVSKPSMGLLSKLMTPEEQAQAAANLQKLGPDAMLLDATPTLTGAAGGLATKPEARSVLVDAVNARHAGQSDRLTGDLDANLGPAMSPAAVADTLDVKRAAVAPLLAQADASPSMWGPGMEALAQRPAMQKALRTASDTAANEGRPLPMVSLDEVGREVSPASRAAYEGYAANAGQHVDDALGGLLGSDGMLAKADDIIAQRKAAADPLYAQFRAGNVPMTDDLADLMKRPSVRAALPNAERLAQDEGKSIYLEQPGADGRAPMAADDGRPFTPLEAYDEAQVPRPSRPDVPRPQDLHAFVRSLKGVQDPKGDLKAMGLDAIPGLIAKPGQGLGPDAMRQAAAEGGYLGAHIDDAMHGTTINDLFDALGSDRPVHSVRDQDAAARWAGYDQARGDYDRGAARNGGPAGPNVPGMPDAGPDAPPARQITPDGWDYVKRALDDKIETAKRGGSNNEARVYTGLKADLVSALDKAVPVYAQARQAFAGHSDLLDALEAGRASAGSNVTREQVQREFGALGTDGERQMYRLGHANGLREVVAKRGNGPNVSAPLMTRQAAGKLATLAPSPEALGQFQQRVADTQKTFTEAQRPDVRGMRYALDALRAHADKTTGDAGAAVAGTRDALAAQLGTVEPFARADLARTTADKGQAAFDIGRKVLRGGENAVWPGQLSDAFDKLPLEQQALLRAGARSSIEGDFGTNRFDLNALNKVLGGENDFNRGKMATLFGPEQTSAMVDAAQRERTFATSHDFVARNSATAPRAEGAKMFEAEGPHAVPFLDSPLIGMNMKGVALAAARKAYDTLANDAARADVVRRNKEIAGLLTLQGPQRDAMVRGILGALARQQDRGARALTISRAPALNAAAIVAAGLANGQAKRLIDGRDGRR